MNESYPSAETAKADIARDACYVCVDADGHIGATFFFIEGEEPTYASIEDGSPTSALMA